MRIRAMLGGGIVLISAAALLGIQDKSSAAENDLAAVMRQFEGHYELVSFISYPEGGGEVDNNYEGRITYDAHGNMTAQGMPKDLPARARASGENLRGGFAYYGDVSWDIENKIVTHHVTGSTSRGSWVGEDNVRHYAFEDGFLKLSIWDANGRTTGTLTWRKFE